MDTLLPLAEQIATRLIARKETLAVTEGSAGGLICAALLAVPGASAYFVGGGVIYTGAARDALAAITLDEMKAAGIRAASEPYAAMLAERMRSRLNTTWALAEAGAAGPTGNRYGDPAGHTAMAVAGPLPRRTTLRTGESNRLANMHAFAAHALSFLAATIDTAPHQNGPTP